MATRKATSLLERGPGDVVPETFWYNAKRRLLGPPMINAQLREQRLSKFLALGVLSPDGISSSAYGTEEILIELIQLFGITAFAVLMPMTAVILFVMLLVVLLYREVVVVYTRAGGSYVVARDNFGPRIAQVAAVALLIDYVVTVAVQIAAGTAAVASAFPAIGPYVTPISIGVILLMCFGNLRGIREAGKIFALPTYLFSGSVILMIVVGIVREALGNLPQQNIYALHGLYKIGPGASSFTSLVIIFTLLKAFANGGASLTGIEAVSNAVSAFKPPEGINARRVLVMEGLILGTLVAGISWLAHLTHAAPYKLGYPTVISQEAEHSVRVRRALHVLGGAGGDRAHPLHRGKHELQRLPVPDQLRRRGLLPAAVVDEARPAAGLLQRHHRADGVVRDADRGGRRQRERARPVLRDRRVHRLHDGRVRHGEVLPHAPGYQAGGTSWSSASRPGCSPRSW